MFKFTPLLSLLMIALSVAACSKELPVAGEIDLKDNDFFSADFALIDMHGEAATDERFEGKPMLLYFGWTNCPDVCPAALGVLVAALDSMGRDAEKIQPLFITVDPGRDTPEQLREFLGFDPRILGLTGSEEQLEEARKAMNVFAAVAPLTESEIGYVVDHQSMFFLVNASGEVTHAFDDNMAPSALGNRLKQLL